MSVRQRAWRDLACVAVALCVGGRSALSEVRPSPLFSDHAVLQQGIPVPVWGTAAPGEVVTVTFAGQTVSATAGADGAWKVALKPLPANATPQTMVLKGSADQRELRLADILVGEVWLCSGQSNMQFGLKQSLQAEAAIAGADDVGLRLLTVDRKHADAPLSGFNGRWTNCTPASVPGFSAVAYFFGRDLRRSLKVPVGLIHASWGGTPAEAWTPRAALSADPELRAILERQAVAEKTFDPVKTQARFEAEQAKHREAVRVAKEQKKPAPRGPRAPESPAASQRRPSALYNAMIAPLVPYALKGAIWYQGEANSGRAREYRKLFPAMIGSWRAAWGQGAFPFLFVQIAPHGGMSPEIREAQLLTAQSVPATAMAVITDHGDAQDIHPRAKEPVGARLALAARAVAYGEKLVSSGPVFKALEVKGSQAVLHFASVGGGLVAKDGILKDFTVAGADGKFVPAAARIEGDTVVVTAEGVAQPVKVRYGWAPVPVGNLYNAEGLPATPFRSDVD